ncbi:hypothetical protein CFP56_028465 [Quercus suber]|uniref:Secreted protein n=1 Tax=Quercus suber TaxID=58331 RepID=A0AAW0JUY2_QUESU
MHFATIRLLLVAITNTHKALATSQNTPLTTATCIDNPFDLEEATRNYFKAKQKGLTWGRLYWQSLFVILKKQYLWYLSTTDVVGNVSKRRRFIKLNVLG